MSDHSIVHVEFPSKDPARTAEFYDKLFGWTIQHAPEFNYYMFDAKPGPGGGYPQIDGQMAIAGQPLVYVGTDDIDASLEKAAGLGATTLMPKTEIPGTGWFAIFSDLDGTRIGLYTNSPAE